MPALLILAFISWLLGTEQPRPKGDGPRLFTALEVRPRRRWRSLFLSIAAHACVVVLLFNGPDWFAVFGDDFSLSDLAKQALVIRMPDRIYLPAEPEKNDPAAKPDEQTPREVRKDVRDGKPVEPPTVRPETKPSMFAMTPPPLPEPVHTPPKKFELPEMRVQETATQTLLQAEVPPNLPPQIDKRLPQLVLWDAEKSKPHPRPFDPGNLTAKAQTPKLSSTPMLEPPNLEANVSTMQVASVVSNKPPTLPLPPANTMPLRLLQQGKDSSGGPGSIDPFTGEPVHILALSTDPLMDDTIKALVIPAGNQLARLPGATPVSGASGFGDGSGDGSAADSPSSGNGKPGGRSGTPGGAGSSSLFGMLSPLGLTGTPLRILHPNNGVFDIVVVQSTALGTFPDGAEVLSGRPIYTVYLQVGASKEWVLQYCIPNSVNSIQTGSLVQLGNPTPVRAPYPMVTLRPPEDWRHGADYLLVHGFLDESGRFRDMRILPSRHPVLPTTGALLQYLAHWEFRPAVQDGHPVKIEVLLAVPPDRMS